MSLLLRRRALLSKLKKFLRTVNGAPPVSCEACTEDPVENYKIEGNSFQNGTPTPDTPVEVESVGERTINLYEQKKEKIVGAYYGLPMLDWEKGYYTLQIKLKEGKGVPTGIYFGFVYNDNQAFWLISNGELQTNIYAGNTHSVDTNTLNIQGVCCYPISSAEAVWDAFDIFLVKGNYNYKNIPSYEPFGYKVPVVARGKNLFNTRKVGGSQGVTRTILSDNSFIINTDSSNAGSKYATFALTAKLSQNTDYRFSCILNSSGDINNLSQNRIYIRAKKLDGAWEFIHYNGIYQGNQTNRLLQFTFNTGEHTDYTVYYYAAVSGGSELTNYIAILTNIQIEYGKVTTDFEPYIDETYTTNIYLDEPLHRVGGYADYVDFGNSKIVKRVAIQEFNGSETWTKHTTTSEGYGVFRSDNLLTPLINSPNTATFMTHAVLTDKGATADFVPGEYRFTASNGLIIGSRLYVGATQTTIEEYTQWLAENKPVIYYPAANPVEEFIKFPQLPTLKGTTVYTIDTIIQPSKMEISYYSEEAAEDVL